MAFRISKFRPLLRISNGGAKPTSKTRPFRYRPCRFVISRSCYSSTDKYFPENKSKSTPESPSYLNSLISKHGRNGDVRAAEKAFARIPDGNVFARTNMITVYGQNGEIEKARKMFDEMSDRTIVTYQAMMVAYGKSNMADQAFEVFSSMPEHNAVSYYAMISAFVRARMFDRADRLLSETPLEFRDPDCSGLVLQGYLKEGNLNDAYRIFDAMALRDMASWSSMVNGYCKAGCTAEARDFFDVMPKRDVATWTSMIHGYFKNGDFKRGFELFSSMRKEEKRVKFNSHTLAVMFGGCGSFSRHQEGFQIHGLVSRVGFQFEEFLGNSMINMYSRFRDMVSAGKIFDDMVKINVITWNSLIDGYVQCGDIEQALEIFEKVPKDLSLCKKLISLLVTEKAVRLLGTVHSTNDSGLCGGLISANMGDQAYEVFSPMPAQDPIWYFEMISAFVRDQMFDRAEKLLSETPLEFRDPNCSGLVLQGYLKEGNLNDAYRIFDAMALRDVVSWSSMVDGYCKAGLVAEARGFFDVMPERNLAAWTSMICGYFKNGDFERGFELFKSMRREEKIVELNSDTLVVMFGGCRSFSKHQEGFQIHGFASRVGFQLEKLLGNSMLAMYIRFGDMVSAAKIFHDMVEIDMYACKNMIRGYLRWSNIEGALEIFEKLPTNNLQLRKKMILAVFRNGLTEKAIQLAKFRLDDANAFWGRLILQLVNENRHDEAFRLFNEKLRDDNTRFDPAMFCCMVSALESLRQGTQIHARIIKNNMESEFSIQNALAVLYSKSGRFSDVPNIFGNV